MKYRSVIALSSLVLIALGIGTYILYRAESSGIFDERLQTALEGIQEVHTYEMRVETSTVVSERAMSITGLYMLDHDQKRYGSYATTTIYTPEGLEDRLEHSFTLQNVSIGDDVYVKIGTDSPLLKKTIPHSPLWRHFTGATIPPQFDNIAVVGPVLDSLAILGSGGAYLVLSADPVDTTVGSSTMHVYTFSLSRKAKDVQGGTLRSLIQRIGTGTLDVIIDDAAAVKSIVVNGDGYTSTTTILRVNTPLPIQTPTEKE